MTMKAITVTISFNIPEKDFKSKEFRNMRKGINSGQYAREFAAEAAFVAVDFKITLKTS